MTPGATAKLTVWRKGEEKSFSLTLGEVPKGREARAASPDSDAAFASDVHVKFHYNQFKSLARKKTPAGGRMSKTRLYPDDIREAVLADIRAFDACRNVRNIAIVPVNAPEAETNWALDFTADGAVRVSHDCKIQMIALQNRMQREYEAIWPDDDRPDRPPAAT